LWDEVWDKMARLWERLTALQVKRTTRPGMHPDGGGLYLMVQKGGGKSWDYAAVIRRVLESKRQPIPDDIPPVGPLFWGTLFGKKLSNMAMLAVLKRMKREDLTAHGFRSTFRDWAAETTEYRSEIVEMALAHTIGNKVEAAYRRGDLFEKRKLLMEDWAVAAGVAERATTPAA